MTDEGLIKTKLLPIISSVVLVLGQIFIFGPAIIYHGNISEFKVNLIDMLKLYAFPGIILLLVFIAIGIFLSRKYLSLYISLIFTIGILLWIQGNILVWKYGLLDGQIINWEKSQWRGWLDISLWLILIGLACIFHRKIHRKIFIVATIVILSIQFIQMGFYIFTLPPSSPKQDIAMPPEEIFELSLKNNIIHIILDAFQSTIFQDIINQDVNYYKQEMGGFTFFRDTVGVFPTTYMTIPAISSGEQYKNDIPMPEFLKRTLTGKTIPNVLFKNGYDVDIIHIIPQYLQGHYSNAYLIPTPYLKDNELYKRSEAALMMDLVLFRYVPHFLKKMIYNNQTWFLQKKIKNEKSELLFSPLSHKEFFSDFITNLKCARNKPVYKFIHLETSHPPAVINKDCEYADEVLPWNKQNHIIQSKCALNQFIKFLNKLKSMGCYDSSMIILQADTGAGHPVSLENKFENKHYEYIEDMVGSALPLLAIKLPYSRQPLKVSNAQVELTDIPATISTALDLNEKFPGMSAFEIDANKNRIRKFYYYKWLHTNWQSDFFPNLTEYIINGSVFDRDSWHINTVNYNREISYQVKKIDFGTDESNNFLHLGWSGNENLVDEKLTFNWALGNSASIFLSLSKNKAIKLSANMKTLKFNNPQRIVVVVDGKKIGHWELSTDSWKWDKPWYWDNQSIIIPPDEGRPNVSIVEFFFSEHLKNSTKKELRPLAVLFESITLTEISTNK